MDNIFKPQTVGTNFSRSYAGSYARQPDQIIPTFNVSESSTFIPYGSAVFYDGDAGVTLPTDSASGLNFAGVAVAQTATAKDYDGNGGYYVPEEPIPVMARGKVNVFCQTGNPSFNDLVYVRTQESDNYPDAVIGGFEAIQEEGKNILLDNCVWGGKKDGYGVAELIILTLSTKASGAQSYSDLTDKPLINGETLEGDKSSVQLGLQATLDFDTTPTAESINPVQSGGIYSKFLEYYNKTQIDDSLNTKIDTAGTGLVKNGTTMNHSNSVTEKTNTNISGLSYDSQGHVTGEGDEYTVNNTLSSDTASSTSLVTGRAVWDYANNTLSNATRSITYDIVSGRITNVKKYSYNLGKTLTFIRFNFQLANALSANVELEICQNFKVNNRAITFNIPITCESINMEPMTAFFYNESLYIRSVSNIVANQYIYISGIVAN